MSIKDESGVEIEHETQEVNIPSIRKENDIEALKSLFKIALSTRDFEITQLVQRNNFFMIFQGVLFAGVMQSSHTKPLISLLVCLVGFMVSLYQVGMASGAKFWQEYWEEALKEVERKLLIMLCGKQGQRGLLLELFHDDKETYRRIVSRRLSNHKNSFFSLSSWLIMKQFSVSRIPMYVGLTLALIWAVMVFAVVDIQVQGFSFSLVGF